MRGPTDAASRTANQHARIFPSADTASSSSDLAGGIYDVAHGSAANGATDSAALWYSTCGESVAQLTYDAQSRIATSNGTIMPSGTGARICYVAFDESKSDTEVSAQRTLFFTDTEGNKLYYLADPSLCAGEGNCNSPTNVEWDDISAVPTSLTNPGGVAVQTLGVLSAAALSRGAASWVSAVAALALAHALR